ncbi:hypothetical protein L1987_48146 [Smallanthus sonchifolius]|uniref:Uncharacterized protein n=1 Tax=Smallanthus sonchifolius TaxID=185202 RepID=A0ACB9FRM8_9ASTR|nr:hypothetical protein L1987_48146 [Smallanthus sonchifolius]
MGTKFTTGSDVSVLLPAMETKALKNWSGKSLIGEVFDLVHMDRLREELVDVKTLGAYVRYVGGLKVMMTFEDLVLADEFRRSQFDLWSRWFSRLYAWEGDPGEFERLAWIVVRGIRLVFGIGMFWIGLGKDSTGWSKSRKLVWRTVISPKRSLQFWLNMVLLFRRR